MYQRQWFPYFIGFLLVFGTGIKIGDLLVRFDLIFLCLYTLFQGTYIFQHRKLFWKAFFLFFACFVSIVSSKFIIGHEILSRDFVILPQIVSYLLCWMGIDSLRRNDSLKNLKWSLLFFILLSGFIGIMQSSNLLGINESWITKIYLSDNLFNKFEIGLDFSSLDRVVGVFGDPRKFGFILAFASVYFLHFTLTLKNFKIVRLLTFIIVTYALILTQSRTAFLSYSLITTVYLLIYQKKILFFLFLCVLLFFNFSDFDRTESRLFNDESSSFKASQGARKRDNLEYFISIKSSPAIVFFGLGPSKSYLPGHEHSEVGFWLIRFGAVGFLFYVNFMFQLLRDSIRSFSKSNPSSILPILVFGVFLVFFFAESIFKDSQIVLMLIILASPEPDKLNHV